MSNWTGGKRRADPDQVSDMRCRWQLCDQRVPYRFYDEQMYLCRDHALLAWSIVGEQLNAGETITPEPRERQTGIEHVGHVYYIATGGRIKIGHSTRIEDRLASYPPDMDLLFIQEGDRTLERDEHRRFKPYLTDGREWFEDRAEVRAKINELAVADPRWGGHVELEFVHRRKRVAPHLTTGRIAT